MPDLRRTTLSRCSFFFHFYLLFALTFRVFGGHGTSGCILYIWILPVSAPWAVRIAVRCVKMGDLSLNSHPLNFYWIEMINKLIFQVTRIHNICTSIVKNQNESIIAVFFEQHINCGFCNLILSCWLTTKAEWSRKRNL